MVKYNEIGILCGSLAECLQPINEKYNRDVTQPANGKGVFYDVISCFLVREIEDRALHNIISDHTDHTVQARRSSLNITRSF